MSYDYSENILVQESAGELLQQELGWEVAFAYDREVLGPEGTFGRTAYSEVLLSRYFRAALQRLNPWLAASQIDEAESRLKSCLVTASLLQINKEKYGLIRNGIPVSVRLPDGGSEERLVRVIDFDKPENNHFLAIREMKIHGSLYRRRTDIVGFVNDIATDQKTVSDEMFTNIVEHRPEGAYLMILGLDVRPEYRHRGYAGMLLRQLIENARQEGRRGVGLTCHDFLIPYYSRFGFRDLGVSASVWGGETWYDMRIDF